MSQPTKADVKVLREILKLVDAHQVDQVVIGGISVTKTRHSLTPAPASRRRNRGDADPKEPTFSSEAPETMEDLDREAAAIAKEIEV